MTLQSQIFIVRELFIRSGIVVIGMFIILYYYNYAYYQFAIWISLISILVMDLIPCSIFHIQYYNHDKDIRFRIDRNAKIIEINDNSSSHVLKFTGISSIRIVMRPGLFNGAKRGICAFDSYHYAVLNTKVNEKFIVTCLLINDMRNTFHSLGIKVNWERRIIPLISEKTKSEDRWK